ncbi:MAG: hypothetical protein MZW92_36230 [Comamonadaceae bacterium]|nr:hypothetical protein [Comamonadaceae bacterium]
MTEVVQEALDEARVSCNLFSADKERGELLGHVDLGGQGLGAFFAKRAFEHVVRDSAGPGALQRLQQ